MADTLRRLRAVTSRRWFDPLAASLLAVVLLAYIAHAGGEAGGWQVAASVILWCAALGVVRRHAFLASVVVAAGFWPVGIGGQADALTGLVNVLTPTPLVVAYVLGADATLVTGLAGVVLMAAALQTTSAAFNPLFEMVTLGPWLAGRLVQSRRRLAHEIAARNDELEAERAAYVRESIRHEQARIARELHDSVGHAVSLIVVQAGAGRRLLAHDTAQAVGALDAIIDAADEADADIRLLVTHLDTESAPARGAREVGELIRVTAAGGVLVRYAPDGDLATVDPRIWEAVYRVVQESLTNSVKHAPGAGVAVSIRRVADRLEVEVATAMAGHGRSGLEYAGGGRGVAGMARRVEDCGGTLAAGPISGGGWRVLADIPAVAP